MPSEYLFSVIGNYFLLGLKPVKKSTVDLLHCTAVLAAQLAVNSNHYDPVLTRSVH